LLFAFTVGSFKSFHSRESWNKPDSGFRYRGVNLQLPVFLEKSHNHIQFSFACSKREKLATGQMQKLRSMAPVIHALVSKHLQLTGSKELNPPCSGLHRQLKQVMNDSRSSILTRRERQVLLLVLHGHSSPAVAEKIEAALRTVKLHRQNI